MRSSGTDDISGKRSGIDDAVTALPVALWRMLAAHRGTVNREMLGGLLRLSLAAPQH